MSFSVVMRRFVGWMACCVILFASLAPTISQALVLVSGNSSAWAEICSIAGFRRVQLDAGGKLGEPTKPSAAMAEHCPFCTLQSHAMALPPTPFSNALRMPLSFEAPTLFLTAPRTLFAWAAAQPRGPPTSS